MHPWKKYSMVVLALIVGAMAVSAGLVQGGRIAGVVTDQSTDRTLSGVVVEIEGTLHIVGTDDGGRFVLENVFPGKYTVTFSAIGYEDISLPGVAVALGDTIELKVALIPAGLSEMKMDQSRKMQTQVLEIGKVGIPVGNNIHIQDSRAGCSSPQSYYVPPAHGGTSIVNDEPYDAMFFKNYGVNPFVDTEDDHYSTFAVDVDDASFIMARSYLVGGNLPPEDAVRVEEFVNHFDYNYEPPRHEPIAIYVNGAPSHFGENCQLLRIGLKGREISSEERLPANLVFVIDVSGSMERENRLGLVKRGLNFLLDQLRSDDRVGIVVYGSQGRELLQPTSICHRERIEEAIESLRPDGATNAEEGLKLGYRMAEHNFEREKINRIILCSDGVANVGNSGPEAILKEIKRYADIGITLSAIGFGMGNYNDYLMEKLGDKGNGHYAYVDDLAEAHRVFVDNLTGNLQVIARDVKIQVDFNPDVIRSYRLLGYENRDVDDDKFRDDQEDGGEIGAGHTVTALYEIKFHKPRPRGGAIGSVHVRFKDAEGLEVDEVVRSIHADDFEQSFEQAPADFRLAAAVAEFAEILRKSYWARGSNLNEVFVVAGSVYSQLRTPKAKELLKMIARADGLQKDLAER